MKKGPLHLALLTSFLLLFSVHLSAQDQYFTQLDSFPDGNISLTIRDSAGNFLCLAGTIGSATAPTQLMMLDSTGDVYGRRNLTRTWPAMIISGQPMEIILLRDSRMSAV
jgi:hypothetical protein